MNRWYHGHEPPWWSAPRGVVKYPVDPETGLILEDGCRPEHAEPYTEVFLRGTPWQVREAAVNLANSMTDCGRFVLSSGCDLPPGVPIDNLKALECPAAPCVTPGWLQAAG
jgi:hypothetical protein